MKSILSLKLLELSKISSTMSREYGKRSRVYFDRAFQEWSEYSIAGRFCSKCGELVSYILGSWILVFTMLEFLAD